MATVAHVRSLQKTTESRWRVGVLLGVLAICVFLSWFIVHFGRWQYGSWDYNTLVDTGWRQVQGQRPYLDFPTTTPPGFNLGIKVAYALFGFSWDATLYFTALFASVTFLWSYWLMVRLSVPRWVAVGTGFAIQCAAMLTGCFWWFNNSTMMLAAIFFLSCLLYGESSDDRRVQGSYVLSLALLSLMKPNIAGILMVGGLVLLLIVCDNRKRLLVCTAAAAGLAVLVLLVGHVSIPGLIANYRSVAKGRLGLGAHYGFRAMSRHDRRFSLLKIAVFSIPLLGLAPRMVEQLRRRDWKTLAISLFCLLSLGVALYGLATNSDVVEMECTAIMVAGAILCFGLRWNGPVLRIAFVLILAWVAWRDLSMGARRTRVLGIGPHMFFESQDNQHRIDNGYLKNMRVSSTMVEVEHEIDQAMKRSPGPYFFGPRLEFNYAQMHLPSPLHSPVLWDPGAAFAASDQQRLIGVWQQHRFATLIFLNADSPMFPEGLAYTFYPQEFRDAIDRDFRKAGSYADITVYRRRE